MIMRICLVKTLLKKPNGKTSERKRVPYSLNDLTIKIV